jgi:hypothetical protein
VDFSKDNSEEIFSPIHALADMCWSLSKAEFPTMPVTIFASLAVGLKLFICGFQPIWGVDGTMGAIKCGMGTAYSKSGAPPYSTNSFIVEETEAGAMRGFRQ